MTAESAALLGLLRSDSAASSAQADWPEFLRLVRGLGVGPYLFRAAATTLLPENVRAELHALSCANAILHLRRQIQFERLAAALAKQDIPVIVVKGMALAHTCYAEPASRPMSDIDLLVKPQDLKCAAEVARRLDFTESDNAQRITMIRSEQRDEVCGLVSRDGNVQLEIHASLPSFNKFGISPVDLWERRAPVQLGNARLSTLGVEDFLHHLCLHLSAHHVYLSRLLGLIDVALFISAHQIDWQWLADESKRVSSDRSVYLTLSLARNLLGARVPDGFFTVMPSPPQVTEMEDLATGQLFFLSNLPVATSVVRLGSSRSYRALRSSIDNHLEVSGAEEKRVDFKAQVIWMKNYLNYSAHRAQFFIRVGILKPSSWRGIAECQKSREQLSEWMNPG